MKDIKDGWVFDQYNGAVCFFEHFPRVRADEIADERQSCHVVETINFTLVEEGETLHHNLYFALDLASAIAMAAKMEIEWQEVAEDVVAIRQATEAEVQTYLRVSDYFDGLMPAAISVEQASQLPEVQDRQGDAHSPGRNDG